MSLQSKIEAVIYASEEPVTLQQLVGLLAVEAGAELDRIASEQPLLPLESQAAGEPEPGKTAGPSTALRSGRDDKSVDAAPATNNGAEVDVETQARESDVSETTEADARRTRERERAVRDHVRRTVDGLIRDYAQSDRGIEIREVASGFRMGTKPEYHDAVRGFVKSLKPALKLTLQALETLAVVAYKQPVTAAEISDIRGVDSAGVLGGLMARKLIATAGRKQVIGRPMLYKTTRDFLLRFGLKDVSELPSMDEFERMAGELAEQEDLPMENTAHIIEQANVRGDAEHIREANDDGDLDESNDAEQAEIALLADETSTQQQATAESAAGGKHDESSTTQAAAVDATQTSYDTTSTRTEGERIGDAEAVERRGVFAHACPPAEGAG